MEKLNMNKERNKGITLIALVITIIVLIDPFPIQIIIITVIITIIQILGIITFQIIEILTLITNI